jgi:glutamyl-tRNA synthetase
MSKRKIQEYEDQGVLVYLHQYVERGYLPEALLNYLARLGWSYDASQEIFSRAELIEKFTLILKLGRFFFTQELTYDADAVKKRLRKDYVPAMLAELDSVIATVEPFNLETLEKAVHGYAERSGRKMGEVVNPLRVATTGQGVGPGLYDCLFLLGRKRCRSRIAQTLALLQVSSPPA